MKNVPRRPQGQSGPAQSTTALEKVGGFVDPNRTELLASFLGGTQVAEDRENGINVSLRLMNKVSETTKIKALTDLQARVHDVGDDALAQYTPALLDCVRTHVDHESPQLRAMVFDLLRAVVKKGKPVKQQLAIVMPSLLGPWVCGMCDMDANVRTSAVAAFHACFPEEKRPVVLEKFSRDAALFCVERTTDVCDVCTKPLLDDSADPKANIIFSSLGALSMLMRHAPTMHQVVLEFIVSSKFTKALAPSKNLSKNALLLRTPRARSSVLSLLKDVVELCPLDAKRHNQVASAVNASIFDCDVFVARRTWELLVCWAKHGSEATKYFPAKFLDSVIDALLACTVPETVEAQMNLVLPFVAVVSKDDRCGATVLDEFCGALVEKVKQMEGTPNIAASEMCTVWRALLELWELLCLRKRDEGKSDDAGQELFAVTLHAALCLVQTERKAARYLKPLAELLGTSLVRVVNRDPAVAAQLFATLVHNKDSMVFAAVPPSEEASSAPPLLPVLQTVGAAVVSHIVGHRGTVTSRDVQSTIQESASLLFHECITTHNVQALLQVPSDTPIPVSEADGAALAQLAIDAVQRVVAADTAFPSQQQDALALLRLALGCLDGSCGDVIRAALAGVGAPWVRDLLHDSLSCDPTKLQRALVDAVAEPFVDARYIGRLASMLLTSTPEASLCGVVCSAIDMSLRNLLARIVNDESQRSSSRHNSSRSTTDDEDENMADDSNTPDKDSSDGEGSDESSENDVANAGDEWYRALLEWTSVLSPSHPLPQFLQANGQAPVESWIHTMYMAWVALAPQLQLDHYASDAFVRVAHAAPMDALGEPNNDDGPMPVLEALDRKKHWVKATDLVRGQEALQHLLDAHSVPQCTRDSWAVAMFEACVLGEVSSYGGCGPLSPLFVFASEDCLSSTIGDATLWRRCAVRPTRDASVDHTALQRGEFLLGEIDLGRDDAAVSSVARTGQLLKLVEAFPQIIKRNASTLGVALLGAFAFRSAFSDSLQHHLVWNLLRVCLAQLDDFTDVAGMLESNDQWMLCATMGSALRRISMSAKEHPAGTFSHISRAVENSKQFVLAVFERIFLGKSVAELQRLPMQVTQPVIGLFEALYQLAVLVEDDILFARPAGSENTIATLHAAISSPATPSHVIVLCLAVLRHTAQKDALPDDVTVAVSTQVAPKKPPHEGLSIVAELMCGRVVSRNLYMDLPRQATALLVQSYALQYLPSNGRLGQRPAARGGVPVMTMIPIARAVRSMLRGLRLHSATDDVLRSSSHLVLFDMICSGVGELQQASVSKRGDGSGNGDTERIVSLLALVAEQLQRVSTADVAPLRASSQSVLAIANVFHVTYQWLNAMPIARLECLGGESVRQLLSAVCSLVHLTLVRSQVPVPECIVQGILLKCGVKPLRKFQEVSTVDVLRQQRIRKYYALLRKAFKQKLVAQMTLVAWAVMGSNTSEQPMDVLDQTQKKDAIRSIVYQLCDLILCLALAPMHPGARDGGRRLHESVLQAAPIDEDLLGYDLLALTRIHNTTTDQGMSLLARGGVSVLTLLLQSAALPLVKYWVETIDKRQREALLNLIENHISPALIQESLANVLVHSESGEASFPLEDDAFNVTVQMDRRSIVVSYQMDEIAVGVRIALPKAFPMRPAAVTADQPSGSTTKSSSSCAVQGVSNDKWRFWILKMSATLFSGSADVWGCVKLFEANVKRHFEGVEPCPICYGVVSSVNNRLPDMRCAVCRNSLFHSSCLYTWWGNSGQTSCPMCRSPWVSQ